MEHKIIINPNDDFSDVISPIYISNNEFAYDIWLFKFGKDGAPYLNGLYRDGIISCLSIMGYFKRYRENNTCFFINEKLNIIEEVELINIKDSFNEYINQQTNTINFDYKGYNIIVEPTKLRETFLRQSHLIFNDKFLEHLPNHTKPILKDNKTTSHFLFKNCVVLVTKDGIKTASYSEIKDCCFWQKQINARDFEYSDEYLDCHFSNFISNVTNKENDRRNAFISAIGYLLHNYTQPSKGQAIICYDEEITDIENPMGGTGKAVFANAIAQLRNVVKIDGKKFDQRDKFKFQDISESTQVVWLDDAKPELGFETFHSCLTDGWSIENKYKKQTFIRPENSPKMNICSNSILNNQGTTNIRRQFQLEFSNHYSKPIKLGNEEPIKNEHGCMFFDNDDWDQTEWNKFYSYMIQCSLFYMANGLIAYEFKSINQNNLIKNTSKDFYEWSQQKTLSTETNYDIKNLFEDFRNIYFEDDNDFKQRSFTNWLKKYAAINNWKPQIKKSNGVNYIIFKLKSD